MNRLLRYGMADAQQWAAFSGDNNPIHFDPARARALGGSQPSVHGMRALLDVKQGASASVSDAAWLRCAVRLRRPLWCDTDYRLQRDPRRAGGVRVIDSQDGATCISCQITAAPDGFGEAALHRTRLSPTAIAPLRRAFAPLLPGAQQWHFADALLFRHLIQDPAVLRQPPLASELPAAATLESLFRHYSVVQTHQETLFDHRLLASWQPTAIADDLIVETLPPLVIGTLSAGAIVRLTARTHFHHLAISSAITLKWGPLGTV
ncbi:MaoC/PaaZ C-terminal domain-containing protein [Pantoea sp. 1.19]|uniref:MaoC/PaaZ C-terminal domain-containing protein n=1 Tax=Pantoea sp. 1.19 TaxID=1925589 RepID=UPI000949071A|nr:MaoC/PaaZ C-terminal domain-containing protein [Pantoea sp. 1.19]